MEYFLKNFKEALAVVALRRDAVRAVYIKVGDFWPGILIVFLPVIVNVFLSALVFPSIGSIFSKFVFWPVVIPPVAMLLSFFVVTFSARKLFLAHGDDIGFFRVLSFSAIVLWLAVIPYLLEVVGLSLGRGLLNVIWYGGFVFVMFIAYRILVDFYHVCGKNAMFSVAFGVATYFIFNLFLGSFLVGVGYKLL